jgi:hypothetical protein
MTSAAGFHGLKLKQKRLCVHVLRLLPLARLRLHAPLALGLVRRPTHHLTVLLKREDFQAIRTLLEPCAATTEVGAVRSRL